MNASSMLRWPASIGAAAALSLLIVATECGCDSRPSAQPAVEAAATRVTVPADSTAPRSFTTSGPLVAELQTDVAAQRDGRVVEVRVDIGDHVRKDQLMALLDDRALHAACDEEKAKVASLQAQVREWQSQQQVDEADLRRADALRADRILSDEDWEHVKYKLAETVAEVAGGQFAVGTVTDCCAVRGSCGTAIPANGTGGEGRRRAFLDYRGDAAARYVYCAGISDASIRTGNKLGAYDGGLSGVKAEGSSVPSESSGRSRERKCASDR
jgi:hypothetical protein